MITNKTFFFSFVFVVGLLSTNSVFAQNNKKLEFFGKKYWKIIGPKSMLPKLPILKLLVGKAKEMQGKVFIIFKKLTTAGTLFKMIAGVHEKSTRKRSKKTYKDSADVMEK